jgi:hypothetical protein
VVADHPVPCPVCGRMDGGHDKAMHDMAGKPVPPKY